MKFYATLGLGFSALLLAGGSAYGEIADARYANTIAQMTAYITNQMAVNNIPGLSIALVDDQTVVWSQGFGYADREVGVAADADTVFHVGSVSKAFLGTAYMQLLDQSKVDLDAPLTNYMAEFSMLPRFTNSTVTIRSLLNHQSGIPGDFFNSLVTTTQLRDGYPAWLINCLQGDYPFVPVDIRSYYCNSGFVLLSDVIRRITGTNFSESVDAMLFTPLGMDASSFLPDKAAISNRLAAAYNPEGGREPPELLNALGSGSMYSSANDLTKYIRMVLANGQTLVSSNALDIMLTPQGTNLPLNMTDSYKGLGWDDANDYLLRYAGKFSWKDGATYMHSSFLEISRDVKLGVAVVQNTAGSQCDDIGSKTLKWAVLDKTGQHWPTNTFVPTPSPVTNWSQAELNALAGLYVADSGYNQVLAGTGTLTFIKDAYSDTPTIRSNLVPRANGWFSTADSQDVQFAFTNLAGYDMVVVHQVNDVYESVNPLGEHYLPMALSTAWTGRTNRVYRMVDMYPDDYFWVTGMPQIKTLRFWTKDAALLTTWMFGMFVIQPTNDNLAFQRGVQYRKGGAVQITTTNLPGQSASAEPGGFELVQYSSFRFIDEAAIPTIAVNTTTNGTIPFANGTQWYFFSGQTGKTYRAQMTAAGQEVFVRLTDREGIVLASGTNGPTTWACSSNATYAIAVSATNVFSFSLALTVSGLDQSRNDFDGDGKADLAVYQAEFGRWRVALSGSGYATQIVPMGDINCLACAADFDGDSLADPAVYDEAAGQLTAVLSAREYATITVPLGMAGEPVFADFDGDRKADPSLYRTTTGQYLAALSLSGYTMTNVNMGVTGWSVAAEDFDGDGKTDPAVYEPANGQWIILLSSRGYVQNILSFGGGAGSMPVTGDYDGDGKADMTVYQPAGGVWLWALSGQGYQTFVLYSFGGPGLIPVPGDYNGDGKTDPAVYDSNAGIWHILLSGAAYQYCRVIF